MAEVPRALAEDFAGGEVLDFSTALDLSTAQVLGATVPGLAATDAGGEVVLDRLRRGVAAAGDLTTRPGTIGALLPELTLGAALGLAFGGAALDL